MQIVKTQLILFIALSLLSVTGCNKDVRRPVLRLPAVLAYEGAVAVNGQPVGKGSVVLDNSLIAAETNSWIRVQYPGIGVVELRGPGRLEVQGIAGVPVFELEVGQILMSLGPKKQIRVKHGHLESHVKPDSDIWVDRTLRYEYICVSRSGATVVSEKQEKTLSGYAHNAISSPPDSMIMYEAPTTGHSAQELKLLRSLIR